MKSGQRRYFEIGVIIGVGLVLWGLARLEKHLFSLSERLSAHTEFITTVIYFGLVNLNVLLILVLSFLIFRNLLKLVLERRRGILGSSLRTKLVIALVFFALAPTGLLFYVSSRFLTDSFDTWFSKRVESVIVRTKEAGAVVYQRDKKRMESLARIAIERVGAQGFWWIEAGTRDLVPLTLSLEHFPSEHRLHSLRLFDAKAKVLWQSRGSMALGRSGFEQAESALERFSKNPGLESRSALEIDQGRDVVKGFAPLYNSEGTRLLGMVMTEERFETQIVQGVEAILNEFSKLRPGAQLIRVSYIILLLVVVMIIVFSAIWLGFYVAKLMISPIQSLAEATRELALGNYDISLEERSNDEAGVLVKSFNRMILDLKNHEAQVQSVTEKLRESNLELERRRKAIEVIVQNINSGVIAIDADERVTIVNQAAERLLAIKASYCLGKKLTEALGDALSESFWRPLWEDLGPLARKRPIDFEVESRAMSFLVHLSRITDEKGEEQGLILVFDDAQELMRTQKVAAWREVARRIAHEIKNPITPIKLSAERLLRRFGHQFEGADREVFTSCINMIIKEVDGLKNLVNEFSRFSRLPNVELKPADLNAVIREVCQLYLHSYPQVHFDLAGLDPQVPQVLLDREPFSRALVNILSNAIHAIEEKGQGGRIEFKTTYLASLRILRLEISDDGHGIPPDIRERVLEPYFSTKKEGSGLGLAIVNQIVADHGGFLRILEQKPVGTLVVIELPEAGPGNHLKKGP